MSACYVLINDIEQALLKRPHHLHAVFIDFSAAFDSGSRMLALDLLAEYGVPEKLLKLFCALLQKNRIDIDDGVAIREGFEQTSGFPQGENTSPILFSILTSKLPNAIAADHPDVKVLQYADDLVLYSTNRFKLQKAVRTVAAHASGLGLSINESKTEAVKFRRGGRLAGSDHIRLNGNEIKYVNQFTYLGITLSSRGTAFGRHIEERSRKAIVAFASIPSPQKLSLATAQQLFNLKLAPIASYGIQLVWKFLGARDFERLNSTKAAFLKRVLGLHRCSRNRLAYSMCGTSSLSAELRDTFNLPLRDRRDPLVNKNRGRSPRISFVPSNDYRSLERGQLSEQKSSHEVQRSRFPPPALPPNPLPRPHPGVHLQAVPRDLRPLPRVEMQPRELAGQSRPPPLTGRHDEDVYIFYFMYLKEMTPRRE